MDGIDVHLENLLNQLRNVRAHVPRGTENVVLDSAYKKLDLMFADQLSDEIIRIIRDTIPLHLLVNHMNTIKRTLSELLSTEVEVTPDKVSQDLGVSSSGIWTACSASVNTSAEAYSSVNVETPTNQAHAKKRKNDTTLYEANSVTSQQELSISTFSFLENLSYDEVNANVNTSNRLNFDTSPGLRSSDFPSFTAHNVNGSPCEGNLFDWTDISENSNLPCHPVDITTLSVLDRTYPDGDGTLFGGEVLQMLFSLHRCALAGRINPARGWPQIGRAYFFSSKENAQNYDLGLDLQWTPCIAKKEPFFTFPNSNVEIWIEDGTSDNLAHRNQQIKKCMHRRISFLKINNAVQNCFITQYVYGNRKRRFGPKETVVESHNRGKKASNSRGKRDVNKDPRNDAKQSASTNPHNLSGLSDSSKGSYAQLSGGRAAPLLDKQEEVNTFNKQSLGTSEGMNLSGRIAGGTFDETRCEVSQPNEEERLNVLLMERDGRYGTRDSGYPNIKLEPLDNCDSVPGSKVANSSTVQMQFLENECCNIPTPLLPMMKKQLVSIDGKRDFGSSTVPPKKYSLNKSLFSVSGSQPCHFYRLRQSKMAKWHVFEDCRYIRSSECVRSDKAPRESDVCKSCLRKLSSFNSTKLEQ